MNNNLKKGDTVVWDNTKWIIDDIDNFINFYVVSIYPDMRENYIMVAEDEIELI